MRVTTPLRLRPAIARLVLVGALAGLSGAACQGSPSVPPGGGSEDRVELPSMSNARWLVFAQSPSADHRLLDEAAAKALHPRAVLGLEESGRCHGFATVEPLAGRTIEEAARAALAEVGLREQERRFVQDEAVLYSSHTAWRIEAWGTDEAGAPRATRITVASEQGHAFAFYAVTSETMHVRMRRCLDTITAAFDMLEGELEPAPEPTPNPPLRKEEPTPTP